MLIRVVTKIWLCTYLNLVLLAFIHKVTKLCDWASELANRRFTRFVEVLADEADTAEGLLNLANFIDLFKAKVAGSISPNLFSECKALHNMLHNVLLSFERDDWFLQWLSNLEIAFLRKLQHVLVCLLEAESRLWMLVYTVLEVICLDIGAGGARANFGLNLLVWWPLSIFVER